MIRSGSFHIPFLQPLWSRQDITEPKTLLHGNPSILLDLIATISTPYRLYFHSIALLPDEKCLSSETEVYLLLSMLSENCFRSLGSLLKPYAAMGGKDNVSLTDLYWYDVALSLWCISLFGSLHFTFRIKRYTHSLIIPQYSVGKANSTVLR